MSTMYSYSGIEKEILPEFRMKLSKAEDGNDVKNLFSQTMMNFLEKVYEKDDVINYTDVEFDPENQDYFNIKNEYIKDSELYTKSDMLNIMKRFAGSAYDRYLHLKKHKEKTNLKIRN